MQKQFPISEAKNKLPAIIHAVENGPSVQFTRHGKPVAVLLSTSQYQRLIQRQKNFWEVMMSFRKSLNDTDLLSEDMDISDVRDRSVGRVVNLDP